MLTTSDRILFKVNLNCARMWLNFVLPFLLLIDEIDAVDLPIFTFSTENRPKAIEKVKVMSGPIVFEHDYDCGDKKWDVWTPFTNSSGVIDNSTTGVGKGVTIGCNYDGSIRATGATNSGGKSCATAVSCDNDDECSKTTQGDNSKAFYTHLDPQCFVTTKDGKLRHRWSNSEKTMRKLAMNTPPGAKETLDDIYVKMPTLEWRLKQGTPENAERFLAHSLLSSNGALKNVSKTFNCKDGCKYGRIVRINYKKTSRTMHFFLKTTCKWFTICTDWSKAASGKCSYESTVGVFLQNGFVSFDTKKTQVPIRLIREFEDKTGIVRVDVTTLSAAKVGGQHDKLAITSMFRQRVLGSVNLGPEMLIVFSDADCLHPEFGLRAQTSDVSVVFQPTDRPDYLANVTTINGGNPSILSSEQNSATAGDIIDPHSLTTPPSIDLDVTDVPWTTTDWYSDQALRVGALDSLNDEKAEFEGHSTWAIFYGWLIGSFLALAVMAPVMYFCRRSLYNNWYRGMYKRYGCDASGTTGGMTGESFGTTTTGEAMTVNSQMSSATNITTGMSQVSLMTTTEGQMTAEGGTTQ